MECIFCKIIDGEIPSNRVYEDEEVLAFRDAQPQAPEHVLIVPKRHIASLDEVGETDADKQLLGHLVAKVGQIAKMLGLENGYRLVCNCGEEGQQTVRHLHFHLLGGRQMTWPPG
ncbi:MAG: histidine triad nucleotide-binding protein [Clostridiales Family XIII bacterium]|nr:histidine triad nucleotide-binding protein [Clostridiales Family XIII bacterium]